jgi:hypothetical protein
VTLTLDNDTVNGTVFTDTAAGATIEVDDGTTLKLNNAIVLGGTINDGTAGGTGDPAVFGSIDVVGSSTISSALLNNGGVTVESGATLTLKNDTVTGTVFADVNTSSIHNENRDGLAPNSSTVSGISAGTMDVSGAVTFQGGVVVNGGAMSIARGATLDIENFVTGFGATLYGVDVMNSGTIQVDRPGPEIITVSLLLDGGTTITGGTLLIHVDFPTGNFEGTVEIGTGGAILDNVTVANNNILKIDDGASLIVEDVTFNGGIINDGTADGTVLSLDNSPLFGNIIVAASSAINGTVVDNPDGTITTIDAILNNGDVIVESGATLTLDNVVANGVTFTGVSNIDSIIRVESGHALVFNGDAVNGGVLNILGGLDSTGDSFINGATITNAGTIDVLGGTLVIDSASTINNTGKLEADGGALIVDTSVSGSIEIKAVGLLELGASSPTAYSGAIVTFDPGSTGTLKIDHADAFGGQVVGLDDNNIDLADIAYGTNPSAVYAGTATSGILSIFVNGKDVSDIHLTGDYLGVSWLLSDDGSPQHGTTVSEVPGVISGLDSFGNATEGGSISASITDGGALTTAQYTWQVFEDGTWVSGSGTGVNTANYTPNESDEGNALRVSISYTDALGNRESAYVSAGTVNPVSDAGAAAMPAVVTGGVGPAGSQAVFASAPNQTLSGPAGNDVFVFNFATTGHDIVTDFHPETDTLQFSGLIFPNAQAVLNATHDVGDGAVIVIDTHDTVTLSGVLKAQLHVSDFHVV